jgi:hypothetical protein
MSEKKNNFSRVAEHQIENCDECVHNPCPCGCQDVCFAAFEKFCQNCKIPDCDKSHEELVACIKALVRSH